MTLRRKLSSWRLGGASYPETGSDGKWPAILQTLGIEIASWRAANCGWEVDWPQSFLERAEGKPLKNLIVRAGNEAVSGELLVTRYGLEGGAIYRLGRTLQEMENPELLIDFKPQLSKDLLRERARNFGQYADWLGAWKLHPAAIALLETKASRRRGGSDRAGEEFQNPIARSETNRGSNLLGRRSSLERAG